MKPLACLALLFALTACSDPSEPAPAESDASPAADVPVPVPEPEPEPEADPTQAPTPWTPPPSFKVLVPKAPGTASGGYPRLLLHRPTGIELLLVPAGRFQLGSTDADRGHSDDEAPARDVDVPWFYLARHETSLAEWRAGGGERGRAEGDAHPITEVSWQQAQAWCEANDLQLPTEPQWEYAASGPDNLVFPWGPEPHDSWCNALGTNVGDRWDGTAPQGSFPNGASWCGAHDLAGNVQEWTRSPWTADHAAEPAEGLRVIRGGSYTCRPPWCLRTAYRDGIEVELQSPNLGFRVALEIE